MHCLSIDIVERIHYASTHAADRKGALGGVRLRKEGRNSLLSFYINILLSWLGRNARDAWDKIRQYRLV